ncbi:MAG: hypothetical protein ABSH32_12340, partial [Bryobacteraceae bacterium]
NECFQMPPEVLFHRYFQSHAWQVRRGEDGGLLDPYRGKHALVGLNPPQLGPLLEAIQKVANEELNSARHQHPTHPPFHCDYIDCEKSINALAFRHGGYSFIGITVPLVYKLWDLSSRLGRAEVVGQPSGGRLAAEEWCEALRVVFFRITFLFVALHEWTHHVHGNVPEGPVAFSETLDHGETASLVRQVWEVDADCYAAYHVAAGLFNGGWASTVLELDQVTASIQDELLFSCFVVGTGAVMFPLSSGAAFDRAKMYQNTHPPQAARMHFLMCQAVRWREQHLSKRGAWMPVDRFQTLMHSVAEAAFEANPLAWDEQTTFLSSEDGIAYMRTLDECLAAYKGSLR